MQKLTDKQISYSIVKCFWAQLGFGSLAAYACYATGSKQGTCYWISIANPFVRVPVFMMGMLGGIQVLRAHIHKENFQDPNLYNGLMHTIFPWRFYSSICYHSTGNNDETTAVLENDQRQNIWRRRVDFNAGLYCGLLCVLATTHKILQILNNQTEFVADYQPPIQAKIAFQLVVAHSHLTIIIGLCMDSGKSVTSAFLKKRVFQFLGRISLSLYLLHWPFIEFIKFCMVILLFNIDPRTNWFNQHTTDVEGRKILLPFWLPFVSAIVVITTSPIVAFVVTKYFEEPLTKMVKSSKKYIVS